ncbi:MAG: hypothetical protein M1815_004179 [Lichina confinis]|nr:MAG: hypothetical protein M1815_004179 [Lichina confinis]
MLPAFPRVAPPGYRPPSPAPTLPLSSSPRSLASPPLTSVLRRLYLSHFLSTWNSRTFEFAAVLFLATATTAFRGTLTYASVYALVRGVAAVAMAPYVGGLMDRADRLEGIRASIVWQRIPVAASCVLFLSLHRFGVQRGDEPAGVTSITILIYVVIVLLACPEKVAVVANTVAVERDWVVVIAQDDEALRRDLNAVMRRIDLFCKLVAPLIVSAIDAYSSILAVWIVLGQNMLSAAVEYYAIAQVYRVVPSLQRATIEVDSVSLEERDTGTRVDAGPPSLPSGGGAHNLRGWLEKASLPIGEYVTSSVFLPSLSLSITYCTVLSLAVPMVAYLLAIGMPAYQVSLLRMVSVAVELSATYFGPKLMARIGPIRSGLWAVNWLFGCVVIATACFVVLDLGTFAVSVLVGGTILSRFGLWGFDLSAQFLIQEGIPPSTRARFSSIEAALQNLFEMLSFVATVVFSRPEQFRYPSMISCGAIAVSSICFTAFARQRRGHLLHTPAWLKRHATYQGVSQSDVEELEAVHETQREDSFSQRPLGGTGWYTGV